MKTNLPVTNVEIELPENSHMVTKTDLKGTITYANDEFVEVSGFTREELVGKNHNVIRHPDMPPAAFADLWSSVKQGKPWNGMVKNRAKSGDHYWVEANVVPIRENGQVQEYMSVRSKPSREQVANAETLYRALADGQKKTIKKSGWINKLTSHSLMTKIYIAMTVAIVAQVIIDAVLAGGITAGHLLVSFGFGSLSLMTLAAFLNHSIKAPINESIRVLMNMAEGKHNDQITIDRHDELGDLFRAMKITQTRIAFRVNHATDSAKRSQRVETALDQVKTNVMIADAGHNIIYTNKSVEKMFHENQDEIHSHLPAFNAEKLIGTNIDVFHKNPAHQRTMIDNMRGPVNSQIEIGGLTLQFIANPVHDSTGKRIGTVVEWTDKTQELAIEKEIASIVNRAQSGELSKRLDLNEKEGFTRHLAEQLNALLEVNEEVINDTRRVMAALSQGDLTQRITADYQGAFLDLKTNINSTINQLTSTIDDILSTAEQVNKNSNEITQGASDLSERTESQAASLENTAASMEEITGTVRNNSQNAERANELACSSREEAEKGGDVLNATISAMKEISQSSGRIADIISVIDEIAFQTNLLALNASVEAAHAGDQGRGFAVVASEVRVLAQRSAEAAKEIKELIQDSTSKVEDGSRLVTQSGNTLQEIIGSFSKVTNIISEINSASAEQAAGIEMMNESILKIDQTTQQNTVLVKNTTSASGSLDTQAKHLTELVSFFRTDENRRGSSLAPTSPAPDFVERRSEARPWSNGSAHNKPSYDHRASEATQSSQSDDWEDF